GWCFGSGRPFDDQPLLARRQIVVADWMGRDDAEEGEAALDLLAVGGGAARQRLPGALGQPLGECTHRLRLPIGSGEGARPPRAAVALGYCKGRLRSVDADLGGDSEHVLQLERLQTGAEGAVVAVGA